ncbi:DUF4097 family beta strand repeat-containing protein [Arenicella xantha]|uniref:Putative adhesin n=1 Tax=Arenicella xantha TaxID=644221 RepID=A0A395JSN0_9GAMM|nr:DUF4097 family beta strand repeat-containing protein [Arenicella xantha]RBP53476.1 putative adhesin [Arenicella xantha]
MKKLLIVGLTVVFSSSAMAWGNCDETRKIDREIAVGAATKLNVRAGAGELEIKGEKRDDIVIRARLCSEDADALAAMDVMSELLGDTVSIETKYPEKGLFGGNKSARIDLVLVVPEAMALKVADSSGDASVENVAALHITDSSGDLEIDKVAGDLWLTDSSGDIDIEDVLGNVELTDSSGDIEAEFISGNFVIDADSSGDIEISDARQDVLIKRDSSGSIEVNNVGGDFTVKADTSGGIKHAKVLGKVSLPRK